MNKKSFIPALLLCIALCESISNASYAEYSSLIEAVRSTTTPRDYSLSGIEQMYSSIGMMAPGVLTINGTGEGSGILGKRNSTQYSGIIVNSGSTLIMRNIGDASVNFETGAITYNSGIEGFKKAVGGDLYEIKPVKAYTNADLNWHDSNSRSSVEMNDPKSRPEIVNGELSIENYDTIYLGFPIWWGTAPMVVHTFLEQYDFSGKKIIIFATSGSSGLGNTANTLKQSVSKTATVIEGDVLNSNPSVENLKQWVKKF